jgi:thymidylate kinase
LQIAKAEPARCAVIDATQDIDAIHAQIMQIVAARFGVGV